MNRFEELSNKLDESLEKLEGDVSLLVKFLKSEEEYKFHQKKQFWAASVIKVPLACAIYKFTSEGKVDLDDKVRIKNGNYVLGSGIVKLLDKKNKYSYKDLLILMLTVSDNTATNELIDLVGAENVEKYMNNLGLKDTTFRHKMMIKAGKGPNLTTVYDIAKLLEMMCKNELPGSSEILAVMQEQLDRTRIPLYIPNEVKISHKYGNLPEAVHEIGVVFSENPFIFCFMSDDQKDKLRTKDVLSKSAKLCFDYTVSQ